MVSWAAVLRPLKSRGKGPAEIAMRILRGESPGNIPFTGTEMNRPMFDWRQLRRWGIREQALPEGSQVLFREPGLWEQHRGYIITGGSGNSAAIVLIAVLLVNRKKRLRAEDALADRLQFETMLADLSARFVDIAPETLYREIQSRSPRLPKGWPWTAVRSSRSPTMGSNCEQPLPGCGPACPIRPRCILLASIPRLWAQLNRGDTFHFSTMADLPEDAADDKESMMRLGLKAAVAVPLKAKGTILGMLAFGKLTQEQSWDDTILQRLKLVGEVLANALAHVRSDDALSTSRKESRQLAGRLLTAQEDERKRLAREMHDDVSQRLAATAIMAGKFEQQFPAADPSREAMSTLKEQLISLSDDVHRISRQLHPAILDDLGLEEAIRSECDRFAEREGVAIEFRCGELPDKAPQRHRPVRLPHCSRGPPQCIQACP